MSKVKLPQPFFYLLGICLFFLFLSFLGIFKGLRRTVEKALIVPLKQEVYDWQRRAKKDLQICELKNEKEVAELKVKLVSLTEENLAQKRLLSAPLPKNWQFLEVKVIGLENEVITIDKGQGEGAKKGMVALFGNTYLGKVVNASQELAEIRLPSYFEEKLAVRLVSKEEETTLGKGLLVGRGEGKMRVEQILTSEPVEKGALVITRVEGGDLLVGEVEEVIESEGEVFKIAQVKRLFNPEELETVFLVRGKI